MRAVVTSYKDLFAIRIEGDHIINFVSIEGEARNDISRSLRASMKDLCYISDDEKLLISYNPIRMCWTRFDRSNYP